MCRPMVTVRSSRAWACFSLSRSRGSGGGACRSGCSSVLGMYVLKDLHDTHPDHMPGEQWLSECSCPKCMCTHRQAEL